MQASERTSGRRPDFFGRSAATVPGFPAAVPGFSIAIAGALRHQVLCEVGLKGLLRR